MPACLRGGREPDDPARHPTTIVPPSNPPNPVTVFLVDCGTPPSLWPTEGTLGRREIIGPITAVNSSRS